jgi:hypothetical protein
VVVHTCNYSTWERLRQDDYLTSVYRGTLGSLALFFSLLGVVLVTFKPTENEDTHSFKLSLEAAWFGKPNLDF